MRDRAWQTDTDRSEFIGGHDPHGHRTGFPASFWAIASILAHSRPRRHTFQSDVETVHRLVEVSSSI